MDTRCLHTGSGTQPPKLIDEQTLPRHRQKTYLPVHVGDLMNGRYKVIAKIGYGAYSTVWLTRDQQTDQYKTVKVCIRDESAMSPVLNEIKMLQHLQTQAKTLDHPGLGFIRLADEIFTVDGPSGKHHCIASKAQGDSIRSLQELFPEGKLPPILVKSLMWHLLFALNWLHAVTRNVHTDLLPQNVLTQLSDDSGFRALEEQEAQNPAMPIWHEGFPIYETRRPNPEMSGMPILTDFGQMRDMLPESTDWAMPDLYRAPEVLLKLPWSFAVDVWSIGVMILELLEGQNLFSPIDHENRQYVLPIALGQYVGLLGLPPPHILQQSPLFYEYFDSEGELNADIPVPSKSLEDCVTVIPPGEGRDQLLNLLRGILTWDSEARLVANEALEHPWFIGEERAREQRQQHLDEARVA